MQHGLASPSPVSSLEEREGPGRVTELFTAGLGWWEAAGGSTTLPTLACWASGDVQARASPLPMRVCPVATQARSSLAPSGRLVAPGQTEGSAGAAPTGAGLFSNTAGLQKLSDIIQVGWACDQDRTARFLVEVGGVVLLRVSRVKAAGQG